MSFLRNRIYQVTPASIIIYQKNFYKVKININKLIRLRILIKTFLKFRNFKSIPLVFFH